MSRPDISRRRVSREQVVRREEPQTEDNFYEAMPVATPMAGRREYVAEPVLHENRGILLAERIVSYIVGAIETLLGLRLLLAAFSYFGVITTTNDFARFIYGLTEPLVSPFAGLFGTQVADPGMLAIAFAMLMYAILGYAIVKLIRLAERRDY
jgi:hypothetical protein